MRGFLVLLGLLLPAFFHINPVPAFEINN